MAGKLLLLGASPIAWKAYRAACTPLSSCEGEYIAASKGAVEILATQHNADFLKIDLKPPTVIFNDNKSAVDLADNNTSSKQADEAHRYSDRIFAGADHSQDDHALPHPY